MKKLEWQQTFGLIARMGDMTAKIPGYSPSYYSVYQGVELTKFYWYHEHGQFKPIVTECLSIEDGMKQVEAHYKEYYERT